MLSRHLLVLCASLAFALPAVAAADKWPAGAKAAFVNECVAGAPQGHAASNLQAYCECAAEQVSSEFSQAEMQAMGGQAPADPTLQQRLAAASSSCSSTLQP
ncbi:hypothetical protein [Pseudomonas sp. UBA2684]|uniref:hypothetical protein n=1 Tax=Pseudomonas sp. UBA2684 TaxID=1947311 RepID=UPI000E859169|nr:hypothetical protein [Pseudomonas sp. UBA2684]HBX55962.1 hypothetical protein [Pseudomonas sp.]|tara:strand:+ start:40528 stop:40833 length:306 start_codon:yes stop_codon:yes gene_type:complete